MNNLEIFQKYFWEYDLSKLDTSKYEQFIIERVSQRCDFDDLKILLDMFGSQKILSTLEDSKNIGMARKSIIIKLIR